MLIESEARVDPCCTPRKTFIQEPKFCQCSLFDNDVTSNFGNLYKYQYLLCKCITYPILNHEGDSQMPGRNMRIIPTTPDNERNFAIRSYQVPYLDQKPQSKVENF